MSSRVFPLDGNVLFYMSEWLPGENDSTPGIKLLPPGGNDFLRSSVAMHEVIAINGAAIKGQKKHGICHRKNICGVYLQDNCASKLNGRILYNRMAEGVCESCVRTKEDKWKVMESCHYIQPWTDCFCRGHWNLNDCLAVINVHICCYTCILVASLLPRRCM